MIAKVNREGPPTFFFESQSEQEEAIISELAGFFQRGIQPNLITLRPEAGDSTKPHILVLDFDRTES